MAYEKFIKKIFPFIGKKYRVPVEEDYSCYNKIEITGEVFLTAEDALVGIDFKTGALAEYTESTLLIAIARSSRCWMQVLQFTNKGEQTWTTRQNMRHLSLL